MADKKIDQATIDCAKYIFSTIDKDNSGFIDKTEMGRLIEQFAESEGKSKPDPKEVEEAMKEADTSNDGKVTFDEFLVFIEKFF